MYLHCRNIASRRAVGLSNKKTLYTRSWLISCRTSVYNYISGYYFLASVLGSATGSLLLSRHVYILNGLSILCFLITAFVAIWIPAHFGRDESVDEATKPLLSPSQGNLLIPSSLKVSHPDFLPAKKCTRHTNRPPSSIHSLESCYDHGAPLALHF